MAIPNFLATHMVPVDCPEYTECSICKDSITDPVKLACKAEHIYCRDCVSAWLATNNTCPMDREVLFEQPSLRHKVVELQRLITGVISANEEIAEIDPVIVELEKQYRACCREIDTLNDETVRLHARSERNMVESDELLMQMRKRLSFAELNKLSKRQRVPALEAASRRRREAERRHLVLEKEAGEVLEACHDFKNRCLELASRRDDTYAKLSPLLARSRVLHHDMRALADEAFRVVVQLREERTDENLRRVIDQLEGLLEYA